MTSCEKVELLSEYGNKQKLTNKHLKKIVKFSDDKDTLVRSMAAELLINFENRKSKEVLLKLACDKKAIVRTDAYDSLSVFQSKDVEKFLRKAIIKEKNEIACAYAIMSWSETAVALDKKRLQKQDFVGELKKLPKIRKSEYCMLNCYYAQYIFGKKKSIQKIIHFLESKNYQVRCAAINTLWEILSPNNQQFIKGSLEQLIGRENTVAVRSNAENLIRFINNGI